MTHGSLFSGIGGFDLASEWMGWDNVFHCEWNPFGQKVLKYYWPNAKTYHDITKTDFTIHRGEIDILTGGFPCQPYSQAGKRLGKEDDRHLWPEMLRAIREIQPSWVVGENVRGLTNWNGGLVFDEVQADLEAEGYEVTPFLLPACAVNAPHRRDRIWFVAYSDSFSNRRKSEQSSNSCEQRWSSKTDKRIRNKGEQQSLCNFTSKRNASNTNSDGQQRSNSENEINASKGGVNALNDFEQISESNVTDTQSKRLEGGGVQKRFTDNVCQRFKRANWINFPTVSPICDGDDGLSDRLDSITFSKWRNESIKAGGNAIVPQVAFKIFKAIQDYERI